MWESAPVGFTEQPAFWNAALAGETEAGADDLLRALQQVEAAVGRIPRFRNGPRELDLDLLLLGPLRQREERLELPHPRLLERPFALVPAAEVAPGLVVPGSRSLGELSAAVDRSSLRRLASPEGWKLLPD